MFYTVKDGQVYNHGEKVSDEEVETMLNNYEYEKRRYTVHMHEQLIKTKAINEHLKRENRLILAKLYRLSSMPGILREKEIDEELVAIDDEMIGRWEHLELENEKLKRQIKLL